MNVVETLQKKTCNATFPQRSRGRSVHSERSLTMLLERSRLRAELDGR